MRQSQLFSKVIREDPKDEQALNAKLLTRAGFIYKNSAGVYSFLPLGQRVIKNITDIVRDEMDKIGGQEIFMAALHEKHYLKATKRWDVPVVYKVVTGDSKEASFNISWTHEEVIAEIAKKYVSSYKDLPFAAYQIQTKFRSEPRAKSGLLRCREFLMKDLYSFHTTENDLRDYYKKVANAYDKVFKRCALEAVYTLAPGGEFTAQNTHEFQVISEAGEDTIYICQECMYAENKELSELNTLFHCPKCNGVFEQKRAIEVGNIFKLGTKYSEAFDLKFTDKKGQKKFVVMGSYGIGLTRTMGTIVEIHHDQRGIVWPKEVAPFEAHLIRLENTEKVKKSAEKLYSVLQKHRVEVLYDDRKDKTAGEKFAEADLIGIPLRIVVSERTLKQNSVEFKKRAESLTKLVKINSISKYLKLFLKN